MLKLFFLIFILCSIFFSQVYAGLIDSLTAVNNKNATIAESLPKRKNESSKYDYLKNNNKRPLETVIDAHKPVNFTFQKSVQSNIEINKLSEKQLEAIGDAAVAQKLAENRNVTTTESVGNKSSHVTPVGNKSSHVTRGKSTTAKNDLKQDKKLNDTYQCDYTS